MSDEPTPNEPRPPDADAGLYSLLGGEGPPTLEFARRSGECARLIGEFTAALLAKPEVVPVRARDLAEPQGPETIGLVIATPPGTPFGPTPPEPPEESP